MTKEEFGKVIAVLRSAYPNAQNFTAKESIDVWYMLLNDLDYQAASSATMKYISNNKFPPTIADIRQLSLEATAGLIPDWGNGWAQVEYAFSHYGQYQSSEAMESFDDITRQVVERLGFINLCVSENKEVDRANFRMIYEQIAKRMQTDMQTPPAVRERISQLADKLAPKQIGANNEA
jgi:hypothetical protein